MDETPTPAPRQPWLTAPVAILLGAVLISGTIMYKDKTAQIGDLGGGGEEKPIKIEDPDTLVQDDDPMIGNPDAKVTIVEFSDFQCPFCRKFWVDTYAQLKKEYIDTGKVRLIYRDYPLTFHPSAKISAVAGNCAMAQGKFWEYHDKLYTEQEKLGQGTITYGVAELKKWAKELGLNTKTFDACVVSTKYDDEIAEDTKDGNAVGVSGTPSFFVNGELLVGAQPYASLKRLIDAAL